ncbi:MAG: TolC family protein [Pseudomonadota bacterium]
MQNHKTILLLMILVSPLTVFAERVTAPERAHGSQGSWIFPDDGAEKVITLERAYSFALAENPTIKILQERVMQAEAARLKAWSTLKPTANFQGTFTHYDQEISVDFAESYAGTLEYMADVFGLTLPDPMPDMGESEPIVMQKQNQFAFNAIAKLPLFVGPAYPGLKMAYKNVRIARLSQMRSKQDFLLQVARAYYLVVSQKEIVRSLANKIAVDRRHQAAAKVRLEVGKSTRADVLRADLIETQDVQNLRAADNNLRAAKRQLAILLGLGGTVDVEKPGEPDDLKGTERDMLVLASSNRADYRAASLAIRAAEHGKNAVWWGFAPSLDMSFMYRWSEAAGFANRQGSWALIFTANLPIYDGDLRYANLRESQSKVREATQQQRAVAQSIASGIVQLRADLKSSEAGVISAQKAVKLATILAADMEASFEAGAATQLDVLDTTQRQLEAEIQLTNSLFQRDLARLALDHALGTFDPAKGKS